MYSTDESKTTEHSVENFLKPMAIEVKEVYENLQPKDFSNNTENDFVEQNLHFSNFKVYQNILNEKSVNFSFNDISIIHASSDKDESCLDAVHLSTAEQNSNNNKKKQKGSGESTNVNIVI